MKKILSRSAILIPICFCCYIFWKPVLIYLGGVNVTIWNRLSPMLLLFFTLIWLEGSSFRKICRNGGLIEVCYYLFPVEIFLLFVFAQWHFAAACFAAASVVFLTAAFLTALFRDSEAKGLRSKRQGRRDLAAARRFFVLAATVLLCVPDAMAIFVYHLEDPRFEARQELAEEIFVSEDADTEAGASEDLLAANTGLLGCFQAEEWKKYSAQERITILQGLVDLESQKLGMPTAKISTEKLNLFIMGQHDSETGEIQIDLEHIEHNPVDEVVQTCLHETYHAFQSYVIDNVDWETDFAECAFFDEARRWRDNTDAYISGYQDYEAYEKQPLEASAAAFAEEEWSNILSYIEGKIE